MPRAPITAAPLAGGLDTRRGPLASAMSVPRLANGRVSVSKIWLQPLNRRGVERRGAQQ